jgi:DNA polymerase/3'-5' exonuclease PolX
MAAPDIRPTIIAELDILRRIAVTESAGVFKARAYDNAIKAIRAWSAPIHCVEDVPAAAKGDGIGKEIRIKILKIIEDGSLDIPAADRARATALEAFQGIYGVGPKKAEQLIDSGYTTIEEIRTALAKNPKLLNKNQQIGLRYYDDLQLRIPRAEMDAHAAILMANKPAALEGVIVGSYRRGAANSGDIDMLVRTADPAVDAGAALTEFVTRLRSAGYLKEVLAHGDHKCLAISQLDRVAGGAGATTASARRLDLLVTPPEEFPFAVFYFTGCDTFNVRVRAHAQELGFTLNEHALTHVASGKAVGGIKTERDIFKALKLEWREPAERTGPDAVRSV